MRSSSFIGRSKLLSVIIIGLAVVLIAKLFSLQVINRNDYEESAQNQYFTESTDAYDRGNIFFEDKDGRLVSAALQASGYGIEIIPGKVGNKEEAYEKFSSVLDLDQEEFFAYMEKPANSHQRIAHKLDLEKAEEVRALDMNGTTVFSEKWRLYPGGNLASHTLGFIAFKEDELAGRYGLERQYEENLSITKGEKRAVNIFVEVFSNIKDTFFSDNSRKGDLVTSIEPVVQGLLEQELESVKNKYSAQSVGGIIMDPVTGEIISMSAKPDFDLNDFSSGSLELFKNPLVQDVLEFGSVVKPLVMAGALDAGVVTAETSYNDTGSVWVEQKEIFNFDKKGRGPGTTMQDVLNESLNTGMVFVYKKLGKKDMERYMYGFGIGEKTGIDLPNETKGLTSNLDSPRDIEYANASFGQGIALTPVTMIRSLASIANGGHLVTPHIVKKIRYENGLSESIEYETTPTEISAESSKEITRMLVALMDNIAEGDKKLLHHSVAVKTGTAQVPNLESGGYYTDRNMHSFFGYFPAYEPRFIVLLYAMNPRGVQYASQTWTDPFLNITKFLLNYYEIPPDR